MLLESLERPPPASAVESRETISVMGLEDVSCGEEARGTRSLGCQLGSQTANGRSEERPSKTRSC